MKTIENFEKWLKEEIKSVERDNIDGEKFEGNYGSIEEIENAANAGDGNACYLMSQLYYDFDSKEAEIAEKYLKMGIKANNRYCTVLYCGNAIFDDLDNETNKEHIKKLIGLLTPLADVSIDANYVLGMIYSCIPNCFNDEEKAVYYMRRAVDHGDYDAIKEILLWNNNGLCNVDFDEKFFFETMLNSANKGDKRAIYDVGACYLKGWGCEKNYDKAFEYANKAAEAGMSAAYTAVGCLYEKGYGTKQDINKAVEFYKKGGDMGDNNGYYCLGEMYYFGKSVPKDIDLAVKYFYEAMNFLFEGTDDTAETAAELLLKIAKEHPEAVDEEVLEFATDVYNGNY